MYVQKVTIYPEKSISNYYTSHYKTMTIDLCGITYPSEKFVHTNEVATYYLFEYIVSGEGEIECEGKKYFLSEGDLAITASSSKISFRSNPKNPYKRLFFCPSGPLIDTLCSLYRINTPLHIVKADCEKEFMQIYDSMKNNTYSEELWNKLVFDIILKASPILSDVKFSKSTSIAELAHEYIHQNIKTITNISDIANALHTSTSNILHTYKKKYGVSPYTTIINRRIYIARKLLETTTMSISEIAASVNFNSTAHFIQMYKKHTGENYTPLQYRNAFLNGYNSVTKSNDYENE